MPTNRLLVDAASPPKDNEAFALSPSGRGFTPSVRT
jgi:hypothetical protein